MSFKNFWICFLIALHKCHVSTNLVVPETAHLIAQLIPHLSGETKSWLKQGGNTCFPQWIHPEHICLPWSFQACVPSRQKSTGFGWWSPFQELQAEHPMLTMKVRVTLPTSSGIWMLLISYSRRCENPGCLRGRCPWNLLSYVLGSYLHTDLRQYTSVSRHKSALPKRILYTCDFSQSVVTLLSDIALDNGKRISFRLLCSALKGEINRWA